MRYVRSFAALLVGLHRRRRLARRGRHRCLAGRDRGLTSGGANPWWLLPVAVVVVLAGSLWQATRRPS